MSLELLKKEFRKRHVHWMTDEDFEKSFYDLYECNKEKFSSLEDVFLTYNIDFIVDQVLSTYVESHKNDTKTQKILKLIKKLRTNPIMAKLYPWFKKDIILTHFMYGSFSNDLLKNYKNIWKGEIPSKKNYNENYIACFGSNTEWAYALGDKLQKNVETYGENNSSVDTIARYIWQYLQYKKPDAIFIMFPDIKRIEYINDDDEVVNLLPEKINININFNDEYKNLSTKANSLLKFLENYFLIKITCKNRNIPFYWYTTSEDLLSTNFDVFSSKNDIDIKDTFFDGKKLIDFSPLTNEKITDIFFKKYKNERYFF
jgi:hypothetical protein